MVSIFTQLVSQVAKVGRGGVYGLPVLGERDGRCALVRFTATNTSSGYPRIAGCAFKDLLLPSVVTHMGLPKRASASVAVKAMVALLLFQPLASGAGTLPVNCGTVLSIHRHRRIAMFPALSLQVPAIFC